MTETHSRRTCVLLVAAGLFLMIALPASAERVPSRPRDVDEELLAELGDRFTVLPTKHFLIYYDTTEIFAVQRSRLFEKLYEVYSLTFDEINLELRKAKNRIMVILFEDEGHFNEHLGLEGETRIAGVYNQEVNRIVFYDANSDPEYLQTKTVVRIVSDELLRIRRQINQIRHPTAKMRYVRLIGQHQTELASYERKLNEMIANQNVAVTIHESTHALSFNLGPFEPETKPPRWLAEGVAMFFETPRVGRWRGAARFNAPRYLAYNEARINDKLPSVADLLTREDLLLRSDTVDASYGAAWAFFYYLYHVHPETCAVVLRSFRLPEPAPDDEASVPSSAGEMVAHLETLMGRPMENIEEDWRHYMDGLAQEFKRDIEGWKVSRQPGTPSE